MNKQKFVQIIRDHRVAGPEELKKIDSIGKDYPYSQVLHILSAVTNYSKKTKIARQKLNTAAVYSTDRSVLKDLVLAVDSDAQVIKKKPSSPPSPSSTKTLTPTARPKSTQRTSTKSDTAQADKKAASKPSTQSPKPAKKAIVDEPSNYPGNLTLKEAEDLRNEVMKNLENLMIAKSQFMKLVGEEPVKGTKAKRAASVKKKSKKVAEVKEKAEDEHRAKLVVTKSKSRKSEKVEEQEVKKPGAKTSNKKEQNQIIEKFIKEDPKIKKPKKKDMNKVQNDLSVGSVEFGEDLVSENLAKIMIKQGKKGKAIDIYKKLIWKYPQKKAYFASQIESIKEK